MKELFRHVSGRVSQVAGSAGAFLLAITIILTWVVTGPLFGFSNTWQLFINTFTTIMTFLMVFLIQNTQNRDGKAMQLKLDELIRATRARDEFVDLEDLSDEDLAQLDSEFKALHEKQASSQVMHKLHIKVAAEHSLRKNKHGKTMTTLINTLNRDI